tara:strand:+ start:490 stop:873 length:384 start_codon:yes stop_codon:yes gene_type:complete
MPERTKRLLSSPVMPWEKGLKLSNEPESESRTRWLRASQYLSRIHDEIVKQYKNQQHFHYRAFTEFKSENALISVYSRQHPSSTDLFVFVILVEKDEDTTLLKWEHAYHWIGGWFTTHLKLLCLLDP